MKISRISYYLVKSCRGIPVTLARVEKHGLVDDRRYMAIDAATGVFLSQRRFPKLALVSADQRYDNCNLVLEAPRMARIETPLEFMEGRQRQVTVHDKPMRAYRQADIASAWFSEYLGLKAELVAVRDTELWQKPIDGFKDPMEVACQDSSPIHLVTEASVAWLNEEIVKNGGTAVGIDRFRPNIVIEGTEPLAEDKWKEVRVGPLTLQYRKHTERCQITQVDQETGEISEEPYATLCRIQGVTKPVFGIYLVPLSKGVASVGQDIHVSE